MDERRYWFQWRLPDQGWGIGPSSAAGWIATGIFVVMDIGGVAVLRRFSRHTPYEWTLIAWAFGCLAAYITLVIAKVAPRVKSH